MEILPVYLLHIYKVYIIFNIAASLPRFCYNLPVHSPYFYGECLVSRHPSLITLLSYLYYIYILPLSYIYDLREADGFSQIILSATIIAPLRCIEIPIYAKTFYTDKPQQPCHHLINGSGYNTSHVIHFPHSKRLAEEQKIDLW